MHARNLGLFALVYKSTMLLLRRTNGKEGRYDAFLAGLAGGYTVFGRTIHSSVSQQIVIYVFARVVLAYAKLLVQPKGDAKGGHHHHGRSGGGGGWEIVSDPVLAAKVRDNGWTVFASVSWALVMYVFRWHPEVVQPSLRSSMHYMWVTFSDSFPLISLLLLTVLLFRVAMSNRTIGIRCGRSSGTTNRNDGEDKLVRMASCVLE